MSDLKFNIKLNSIFGGISYQQPLLELFADKSIKINETEHHSDFEIGFFKGNFIFGQSQKEENIVLNFYSPEDCNLFRKSFHENDDKPSEQKKLLIKLFSYELNDDYDRPTKMLNSIIDEYMIGSYSVAFTVMVQSSGTGKSKMCWNLQKYKHLVYVNFNQDVVNSGIPKNSNELSSLFFDIKGSTLENIKQSLVDFINTFIFLSNVDYANDKIGFFDKYSRIENNIVRTISEKKELVKEKLAQQKNEKFLMFTNANPIVFVFDESSILLEKKPTEYEQSFFFTFRSVLANESLNKAKVFAIFLDTNTSYEKFYEKSQIVRQDMQTTKNKVNLVRPIYILNTWDLFTDMISINNIFDTVKIENVLCYGRPLWGSFLKTCQENFSQNLINLKIIAVNKLIGKPINYKPEGKSNVLSGKDFNNDAKVAILSVRVGSIKPKSTTMANDLVSNYMAICSFIDQEKNVYECIYPSEPFLAMISAECMNIKNKADGSTLLSDVIKTLIDLFETSVIDCGEKGELVAKLILLSAMDECCKQTPTHFSNQSEQTYLKVIQIRKFINLLYGPAGIKLIENQLSIDDANKFLDGYINFNHFIESNQTKMIDNNIECMLKRCSAFHCDHSEKGVDLIIPVCLDKDNICKSTMSAIFVQVKLHSKPQTPSQEKLKSLARIDMGSINCNKNAPFLFLFMQLGHSTRSFFEPTVLQNLPKNGKRASIYSVGLPLFLNEKASQMLTSFISTDINFDEKLNKYQKKAYRSMTIPCKNK